MVKPDAPIGSRIICTAMEPFWKGTITVGRIYTIQSEKGIPMPFIVDDAGVKRNRYLWAMKDKYPTGSAEFNLLASESETEE